MQKPILEVVNVRKYFYSSQGFIRTKLRIVKAVDDVIFTMPRVSFYAIVGESGSGKTTLGKIIVGLYRSESGKILVDGIDITRLEGSKLKQVRRKVTMVFQDPASSLNPRRTVKDIVMEPLNIHKLYDGSTRLKKVKEFLDLVELPEDYLHSRPYELSGGQKQRVGLARALITYPNLVILDEPTSALDVSVQAKILNLLKRLRTQFQLSYLLITHDLSVVRNMAELVLVMYRGKMVETASSDELFGNPLHPYTLSLLSSIPTVFDEELRYLPEKVALKGEIPSPFDLHKGCVFNSRCPQKIGHICEEKEPPTVKICEGHFVSCHLFAKS